MSTKSRFSIGVLAIQGSVIEHVQALKKCGAQVLEVRTENELDKVAGLIIPGGESTTISKLLITNKLDLAIKKRALSKKHPLVIWGSCAGAILLAKEVENRPPQSLKLLDITIERNAYGHQAESFETALEIPVLGPEPAPVFFIRAPRIRRVGRGVEVLAEYEGEPVMVRERGILATMFHPELTDDTRLHAYFISLVHHYA
ncbi:pyridoxal 5'-phosphate synthase glutaminase subunit PdxT [Candidatus Peregrinibacteria bacterium CG_4_9_14_0_2_um_filter_53_11]|nr:MAG: pyridoxal 5'-phosphate synthase glutaminase subunit PdxT [Candidatus Peregrinibacteria bacterium CG_4_9_14_0_2_um_filter_53_11]